MAIPEHWPRWVNILLFFLFGSGCIAPTIWFLLDPAYTTFGLLEVLFGVLGVFSLVISIRLGVLALLVGRTIVEISKEPAVIGERLDYFLLQGRPSRSALAMDARLLLRRYGRGSAFSVQVSVPLASSTVEPDGRRRIEGSLVVPPYPPSVLIVTSTLEWLIEVRIRFKGGHEHEEDRPLVVVSGGPR